MGWSYGKVTREGRSRRCGTWHREGLASGGGARMPWYGEARSGGQARGP